MKIRKYFALIFIICINTFCKAQFVSLSMTQQNIAYLGVDNPFHVSVSNYPISAIRVKVDNGTITGTNGVYQLRAKEVGKCIITVEVVKNGKRKTIGKYPIRIKEINKTNSRVGNLKQDSVSCNIFKAQQGVIIELSEENGFYIEAPIETKSFKSIIIKYETKQVIEYINNSAYFCMEMKSEMDKLQVNDKVIIYEIKGKFVDGKIRDSKPLIYIMI